MKYNLYTATYTGLRRGAWRGIITLLAVDGRSKSSSYKLLVGY
jgi:hypothetical protein